MRNHLLYGSRWINWMVGRGNKNCSIFKCNVSGRRRWREISISSLSWRRNWLVLTLSLILLITVEFIYPQSFLIIELAYIIINKWSSRLREQHLSLFQKELDGNKCFGRVFTKETNSNSKSINNLSQNNQHNITEMLKIFSFPFLIKIT